MGVEQPAVTVPHSASKTQKEPRLQIGTGSCCVSRQVWRLHCRTVQILSTGTVCFCIFRLKLELQGLCLLACLFQSRSCVPEQTWRKFDFVCRSLLTFDLFLGLSTNAITSPVIWYTALNLRHIHSLSRLRSWTVCENASFAKPTRGTGTYR